MNKVMYKAEDIAEDLAILPEEAQKLIKGLADRMEKAGHLAIRGMVPRAYYEKQKEAGFLLDELAAPAARVPLNEKRLLCLKDFCIYSSLGQHAARKLAAEIGIERRIGHKVLYDRAAFDRWCDSCGAAPQERKE